MIDSIADTLFSVGVGMELAKDAQTSLIVNNSRYLLEAVERSDLDIALITKPQQHLPSTIESKPVAAEPLVVVARSKMSGKTLPNFIAYDQPSNTFRLVNEALKNYGVTPQISFYSTSPDVTLRLVLQNKGIAALPYLLVRDHLKAGTLHCLGDERPWLIPRDIVAIKRRDKELPLVLKQLTYQTATQLDALAAEAQA
jgi:DNA-binding transcriptional LysR family regulator